MTPAEWMISGDLSRREAARILDTDPASVARYQAGEAVRTRRLAERFSAATGGRVSIEEWLFPGGVPAPATLTAAEAAERSAG